MLLHFKISFVATLSDIKINEVLLVVAINNHKVRVVFNSNSFEYFFQHFVAKKFIMHYSHPFCACLFPKIYAKSRIFFSKQRDLGLNKEKKEQILEEIEISFTFVVKY